ncbi:MAG: DegT/DnrJ/EryC1/StrS family aminotransferase [archaeon]
MREKCIAELKKLTGKKYIAFTKRGNAAIKVSLKLAKDLGNKDVIIQDQGGWITYSQFIGELKLNKVHVQTDYGLIDVSRFLFQRAALLINSMPGYFALQDMKRLYNDCRKRKVLVINDVSGSIGTDEAKFGDIILGSFGRWKPLNVEEGGFLATDNQYDHDFFLDYEVDIDYEKLYGKLLELKKKLSFFKKHADKIKKDLNIYNIIHKDKQGLNVVVKFSSEKEKEKLIKYCEKERYEYVECPKYIRVLDNAISIEVKRLEG